MREGRREEKRREVEWERGEEGKGIEDRDREREKDSFGTTRAKSSL